MPPQWQKSNSQLLMWMSTDCTSRWKSIYNTFLAMTTSLKSGKINVSILKYFVLYLNDCLLPPLPWVTYYLHLPWVTCHDNLPLVKQQMIITAVMAMANKIPTTMAAISPAVSLETETTSYTSAGKNIK